MSSTALLVLAPASLVTLALGIVAFRAALFGSGAGERSASTERQAPLIGLESKLRQQPSGGACATLAEGEGGVLLHLDSGQYHGVNPVGLAIWELLEDGCTVRADRGPPARPGGGPAAEPEE